MMASILKDEVNWKDLPDTTSSKIRALIGRCLTKDPHNRLHDIADARLDIQDTLSGPAEEFSSAAKISPKWRTMFWTAIGFAFILSFVLIWSPWRTIKSQEQALSRFIIDLPQEELVHLKVGPAVALSPDGSLLVYVSKKDDTAQLYKRPINAFEAVLIPGTEGGEGPFFSPDGKWIAFYVDGKLKKVSLLGGNPQTICEAKFAQGGSWGTDDTIYFADTGKYGLMRVSAAGGDPEQLTTALKVSGDEFSEHSHFWPHALPNGKQVFFTIFRNTQDLSIAILDVETGEYESVIDRGMSAKYLPSGHLLYAWAGDLIAVPFDLKKMKPSGAPIPVLEGVTMNRMGLAHFSLSDQGSLAYIQGSLAADESEIVSVDLDGKVESLPFPPGLYQSPRLSPDGRQLVITKSEPSPNLWIYGLERGTLRRLTDEQSDEYWAIWTPDGMSIVYNSTRSGEPIVNLHIKPSDGSSQGKIFTTGKNHQQPKSWSPDGKLLLLTEGLNPDTGLDILILSLEGEKKPELYLNSRYNEGNAHFSPDGRWIAFASDESGRFEIYVQTYPGPGPITPISTDGGIDLAWAPDGKALYYRDISGDKMMKVSFITEPELHVGKPQILFEDKFQEGYLWGRNFDIFPDGKRFIMLTEREQEIKKTQIHVAINWLEELKRLVPSGK
jgi:serine/threonine-protein kinase